MTDSGPPRLPPRPLPGQSIVTAAPPRPNAQIVTVPPELRDVKEPVKLEGTVEHINTDGTIRIKTDKGEIDVRLDPRAPVPQEGETVELEIPPGRPPSSASVRTEKEAPSRPPAAPPLPEAPPQRPAQTPVDINIRSRAPAAETPAPFYTTPAPPPQAPPPLPHDAAASPPVRLQPLTEAQALSYIAEPLETIATVIEEKIDFVSTVISSSLRGGLQADDLSAVALAKAEAIQNPHWIASLPLVARNDEPIPLTIQSTPEILATPVTDSPVLQILLPDTGFPLPSTTTPEGEGVAIENPVTLESLLSRPALAVSPVISETFSPLFTTPVKTSLAETGTPFPKAMPLQVQIVSLQPAEIQLKGDGVKLDSSFNSFTPSPFKNQKAGTIIATVVGATPQKLPVLSLTLPGATKESFFILQAPGMAIPPGTQMELLPQEIPAAPQALPSAAPAPLSFFTPGPWPAMDEIYQALSQIVPQAAQAITNMTPSPASPAQFTPAALFFIAALRGGDLTDWLGEKNIEALRRAGRTSLLARLGQEGSSLLKLSSEPVTQDWRALALPLFWQNEIHKMVLHYRQDFFRDPKTGEGGKQVRFIFDLTLSAMGPVQLDGLFRPNRLDLILRTREPLSLPMQNDMKKSYINALEQAGISGEISFQNKLEQWVKINAEKRQFGLST